MDTAIPRTDSIMELLTYLSQGEITPEEAYDTLFIQGFAIGRYQMKILVEGSHPQSVTLSLPIDFFMHLKQIIPPKLISRLDTQRGFVSRVIDMIAGSEIGPICEVAEGEDRLLLSLEKA
jgi:hypothetical protein